MIANSSFPKVFTAFMLTARLTDFVVIAKIRPRSASSSQLGSEEITNDPRDQQLPGVCRSGHHLDRLCAYIER
jgi:hypothetical protein